MITALPAWTPLHAGSLSGGKVSWMFRWALTPEVDLQEKDQSSRKVSSSKHGEYEPLPASKVQAGSGAAVCFCPPMFSHPEERSGALILRLRPLLGGVLGEFSDERRWSHTPGVWLQRKKSRGIIKRKQLRTGRQLESSWMCVCFRRCVMDLPSSSSSLCALPDDFSSPGV
ncbi:hypothetical protein CRENBAI_005752 [Crenichthys baileyi]|uniref:Uncharacterized protein n=1 Tax=Crenichthys baileyi TaxID=28760 RepID=A0AAV9QZU5_9TELE